ncbi:unnamed protein product [Caenorhabditis bovis]|uniref:Uncharacterized protein n=1 Tax=Caenorhabditis bovis TaxID=2654633 RepID=A0A8S1ET06_9PELO|nr:unnamed protein product [Caenorhabditis bovis]
MDDDAIIVGDVETQLNELKIHNDKIALLPTTRTADMTSILSVPETCLEKIFAYVADPRFNTRVPFYDYLRQRMKTVVAHGPDRHGLKEMGRLAFVSEKFSRVVDRLMHSKRNDLPEVNIDLRIMGSNDREYACTVYKYGLTAASRNAFYYSKFADIPQCLFGFERIVNLYVNNVVLTDDLIDVILKLPYGEIQRVYFYDLRGDKLSRNTKVRKLRNLARKVPLIDLKGLLPRGKRGLNGPEFLRGPDVNRDIHAYSRRISYFAKISGSHKVTKVGKYLKKLKAIFRYACFDRIEVLKYMFLIKEIMNSSSAIENNQYRLRRLALN